MLRISRVLEIAFLLAPLLIIAGNASAQQCHR